MSAQINGVLLEAEIAVKMLLADGWKQIGIDIYAKEFRKELDRPHVIILTAAQIFRAINGEFLLPQEARISLNHHISSPTYERVLLGKTQ